MRMHPDSIGAAALGGLGERQAEPKSGQALFVTDPGPQRRQRTALLFANSAARRVKQSLSAATECLEAAGIDLIFEDLRKTSPEDALQNCPTRPDMIIAAGGDGTCNAVVNAVVPWELPLGILPLGTANDLARTLNIPEDIEGACEVIASGATRAIDLGRVNGKYFFNVASIGLSVSIARELSGEIKRRWGVLGYLWTALRVTFRARPFHATIRCGERTWRVKTLQIAIGNGRFYGGGMAVAEDAEIDDQKLDLYSLEVKRRWQVFWLFPALRRGSFKQCPDVRTLKGQSFEIRTRKPRRINCDGELLSRTPATFELVPRCLRIYAPPPDAAAR